MSHCQSEGFSQLRQLSLLSIQGHVTASQRALEAFLTRYPLCYGYWKKLTDLERRAGDNAKAEEVKQLNPSGHALVDCVCAKSLLCVLGVCPRSQSNLP